MDELSIEEKAKRYDEALAMAKDIYNDNPLCGTAKVVCKQIFHELEESEDERIRRALMQNLKERFGTKGNMGKGLDMPDVLAWLEKQGEQTPADKVEPIFKVGDWFVNNKSNDVFLIKNINSACCVTEDAKGNIYSSCVKPTEDEMHLWTIQDAKDGDVLYCKSDDIEYIVMNKGVNEHGYIDSYFRYNSLDGYGFGVDIPSVLSTRQDNITPATKEQRDLLFSKMKDAGYEWDAEKKELKKIEQKPVIMPKYRVGDIVRDIEDNEILTIKAVTKDRYIYANLINGLTSRGLILQKGQKNY